MAASAERCGDFGGIDPLVPAPRDGEHTLVHLDEQDERARRLAEQRIDWRDGASLPFLGETTMVRLSRSRRFPHVDDRTYLSKHSVCDPTC